MTIVLNKAEYERLVNTLDKAGDLDTSPAVQKGLKEGATAIKTTGKANLSTRNGTKTGNLKKSFTIKVTRRKKVGSNYALSGFKRGKGGGSHAHWIDKGTAVRHTKQGYSRGSITGTKFWSDAVQSEGPRALNNLVNIIEGELRKIMG